MLFLWLWIVCNTFSSEIIIFPSPPFSPNCKLKMDQQLGFNSWVNWDALQTLAVKGTLLIFACVFHAEHQELSLWKNYAQRAGGLLQPSSSSVLVLKLPSSTKRCSWNILSWCIGFYVWLESLSALEPDSNFTKVMWLSVKKNNN